jgi:hypothetical protein
MANFQILETSEDISNFDLPLNRTVKLKQWGGDGDGNRLEVALEAPIPGVTLTVLPDSLASASTAFTLNGTQKGAAGNVSAFVAGSGHTQYYSGNLKIRVCGEPKKCAGYDVDLLSDLAIKGNGAQIKTYSKILGGPSNKHNMLSQDPDKAVLDCGDVAGGYGSKLFGKPSSTAWFAYYSKPTSNKRADLRFEPSMMRAKINRIKTLLNEGTSVRVWVVDSDGFSIPSIQSNANNTHFVTIVGYSDAASKFMFIDPWPGGSSMSYDGGMYGATTLAFFGELILEPMSIEKGIRSPAAAGGTIRSGGTMSYTVIAGP